MNSPSLYDSFNARALSPEKLAEIFIPNDDFEQLSRRSHSVVVGPRGSGKTALLKMLQPRALMKWNPAPGSFNLQAIDFIGVYVPADVSWREQLEQFTGPQLDDRIAELHRRAALTCHVLRSFVACVSDACSVDASKLPLVALKLNEVTQRRVAAVLAKRWMLELELPTLAEVRQGLQARIADIWAAARNAAVSDTTKVVFDTSKYLYFSFRDEISFAVDVINEAAKTPERRWALLFDELEIVPPWVTEELFTSLRSSDQRIIYKLAISPYSSTLRIAKSAQSASAGQDYNLIQLYSGYKSDSKGFCRELFLASLRDIGKNVSDPSKVLGTSPLKAAVMERGRAYRPGSANYKLIHRAIATDPSFAAFCLKFSITPENLEEVSRRKQASLLRKILPTLRVRDAFRKVSGKGEILKRGRKNPDLYAGFDTFLEMLEGNPRWIIGITRDLARTMKNGKVPPSAQVEMVSEAANRFSSILKTIPISTDRAFAGVSLLDLLKTIGHRIFDSVVFDDFSAEPLGSITVDKGTSAATIEALGVALNTGALVSLTQPDRGAFFAEEILGHRLRLTYLFSPIWGLPVRLGRHFPLSEAIEELANSSARQHPKTARKRVKAFTQPELPFDE